MPQPPTDTRLRLFAFTQAQNRLQYLAVLQAFDSAREQSRLQLGPADLVGMEDIGSPEEGLRLLDQLWDWGLVERLQDDRRVRTVAEYRQRRSIYQLTELGLIAWSAVKDVLEAEPGAAELRKLVLPMVLEHLQGLPQAIQEEDAERAAFLLAEVHRVLDDLAHHAARFTVSTSQLAASWEADPETFLAHKGALLSHLHGFLAALSSHRPLLAEAVGAISSHEARLFDLVASASGSPSGKVAARERAQRRWEGVVGWFVDRPGAPSQASTLVERTSRAIRDLAVMLRRVIEATSGGVSRATQLELLAEWIVACPGDDEAHALVQLTSGLRRARHFGGALEHPDQEESSTSWWEAPPARVDTTLRKTGKRSAAPPPSPVADRRKEKEVLRWRQAQRREAKARARQSMAEALGLERPLTREERVMLQRLLTRALHARRPAEGVARTTEGSLRLRLVPWDGDGVVPTQEGDLVLPGHRLEVSS